MLFPGKHGEMGKLGTETDVASPLVVSRKRRAHVNHVADSKGRLPHLACRRGTASIHQLERRASEFFSSGRSSLFFAMDVTCAVRVAMAWPSQLQVAGQPSQPRGNKNKSTFLLEYVQVSGRH
jgi:hypothetical protein